MNNDLISREALKERLKEMFDTFDVILFDDIIAAIDNAPTVEAFTEEYVSGAYNEGYMCGSREAEKARPQGDIRWTDKLTVTSSGDIIDFEGRVVGHINLEDMKGGAE